MISSSDMFWSSVGRWQKNQSRIVVECECTFPQRFTFGTQEATVSIVQGSLITFRDREGEELELDFSEATIRLASFEKIDSDITASVFRVFWEDSSTRCTFTELRDPGKPN